MNPLGLSEAALAAVRASFFVECEELLTELETGLLALQDGAADADTIDAVFRAVHSIKGAAGAFAYDELVGFADAFETVLDKVRAGVLAAEAEQVRLLLRAADVLADLVRAAREAGDGEAPARVAGAAPLIAELAAAAERKVPAGGDTAEDDVFEGLDFTPVPVRLDLPEEADWTIRFRPHGGLYARAGEAMLLLRDLAALGQAETILDTAALPAFDALDPDEAYLAWTIRLRTSAGEAAIRDVFAFSEGDCDLELSCEAPARPAPQAAEPPSAAGETAMAEPPAPDAPEADAPPVELATTEPGAPRAQDRPAARTIRVDLERIDRLINLVGELVINQSMLMQGMGGRQLGHAAEGPLDALEHLTRDIQETAMAMRAQPVRTVFQRLPRLVREVEAATGKQVRLAVAGEDTEVDRTVIERLIDPLTHMIRNAIDHGLESPAERAAAGKPEAGLVRVTAGHRGGRIVVEVSDDGRGLDRARVREIAVRKGLVARDAVLSDEDLDNLIFAPGFSTAEKASTLSGRGVGMDVVKREVQALGGRIGVASRPGQGVTFTLSLPLTLAVLDGMVADVAGQSLIVPLTSLIESVRPPPSAVRRIGAGTTMLSFRGEHVPMIDLGAALGYRADRLDPCDGVALVVEDDVGRRAALVVDEIRGQQQVVIKSLEAHYRPVQGVAAATILGDGRVALILDVGGVIGARRSAAPPLQLLATG